MILMPGFDGTGELFAPLTAALPPSYQSTVIQYRDERTFDDYVNTVSAALPDDGAILIAESFSGPIALAAMARHPTKIRCAVLCATFVESPFLTLTKLARFVPSAAFRLNIGHRAMLRQFCAQRATAWSARRATTNSSSHCRARSSERSKVLTCSCKPVRTNARD